MITTCIFNLDGVIVDTAKYHFLAWSALANELGFEFTQEQSQALRGASYMRSLEIFLGIGGMNQVFSDTEKINLVEVQNTNYANYISAINKDDVLPGVKTFLTELRSNGIKVALASSSKNAQQILDKVGIEETLFDVILEANVISKEKPEPHTLLLGAKLTNSKPKNCVVFESTQNGIEAARKAKMKCVSVGYSPLSVKSNLQIHGFENFGVNNLDF